MEPGIRVAVGPGVAGVGIGSTPMGGRAVVTLVEPRWDEARAALADAVSPLPPSPLPVASCDGLVLAEDLRALIPLPGFDTSAMDGWAVAGPGPWTLRGTALAGRPSAAALRPGDAVTIATGGLVPAGASAVIRSEVGRIERPVDGTDVLHAPDPGDGDWIRPAGEEAARGEVLATVGTVLSPALVGLAAAAGHDDLTVIPRPRVALLLFGDELATSGVPPRGMVRDSLGPQVPAWLARMGARTVTVAHGADTLAAHVAALDRAAGDADLILTTGGTAAGPVDHLHSAIDACAGRIVVDRVAVRPGHPMLAATVGEAPTWLVGLPGNPQSAIVALLSLAAPILAGLAGRPALPPLGEAAVAVAIPAPPREDRLVLGTRVDGTFRPSGHLGSGMLRGLAESRGFAVLPPGGVAPGDRVRWLPLP